MVMVANVLNVIEVSPVWVVCVSVEIDYTLPADSLCDSSHFFKSFFQKEIEAPRRTLFAQLLQRGRFIFLAISRKRASTRNGAIKGSHSTSGPSPVSRSATARFNHSNALSFSPRKA